MIPVFDLKRQYAVIGDEVQSAVQRVLESGWYVLGREVAAFEEEFAAYVGVRHGIGVASGTEALQVGLMACGIGAGDEVITVSHTASATAMAVLLAGATPVFVDIDPATYTMRPELVEAALTARTKAVLPVHIYGQPAGMAPVMDVARGHGLRVIEDCAQAHGATYRGQRVGAFGDLGCFSFYPAKNLGAYGDGGIVVTNDDALAEQVRLVREYGWRRRYVSEQVGLNSRLDEVQAAVLRVKLRYLDGWNAARRQRAARYGEALAGAPLGLPQASRDAEHVYHLYVVRTPQRDALQRHLAEHAVGSAVHYPVPVHLQDAFGAFSGGQGSLPETEAAANEILDLPMYPELPLEDVDRVAAVVRAFAVAQGVR